MKVSKPLMTGLVIIGIIAVVVVARSWQKLKADAAVKAGRPALSGRTFGAVGAPVKIVEFTDFQCPACAKASQVIHQQMNKDGTKIFLELKYFPLPMHKNARRAAMVAECALRQGKFWPMHDLLFSNQQIWEILGDPDDNFLSLARGLGLDDKKMMRCISDKAVEAKIDEDQAEGKNRGVHATPTFFVNGKMAVGIPGFQKVLAEALK